MLSLQPVALNVLAHTVKHLIFDRCIPEPSVGLVSLTRFRYLLRTVFIFLLLRV